MPGVARLDVQSQPADRTAGLDAEGTGPELVHRQTTRRLVYPRLLEWVAFGPLGCGEKIDQQDQLAQRPANQVQIMTCRLPGTAVIRVPRPPWQTTPPASWCAAPGRGSTP